jgi:hypothetical protein
MVHDVDLLRQDAARSAPVGRFLPVSIKGFVTDANADHCVT